MECVKVLLDKGADINMQDEEGWTPLMRASNAGHMECVKVLLDKGAEVNMQNMEHGKELRDAAYNGDVKTITRLLNQGADINGADEENGETALMRGSGMGHLKCVKELLEKGAQVNVQSKYGGTALMEASGEGHVECVKELLTNGAQVNVQNKDGLSSLMLASGNGHGKIVKVLLLAGAQANHQDADGRSSLFLASGNGLEEVVSMGLLLDLSIKATKKSHEDVVRMLLSAGAQVDLQDKYAQSSLILASENGHEDVVRILLSAHARVNQQNESGWSPLMRASRNGHEGVLRMLLSQGATVDVFNKWEQTALMKASEAGYIECVKVLLDCGAQANMQSKWGETALMMASKSGHMECVKVLSDKGAEVNIQDKDGGTALMKASEAGHIECVQVLLDKGADVNMQEEDGGTALMKASEAGHIECVQVLLDKGADINMQNKYEWTALMRASDARHIECVQVLLDKGAKVNMQNNSGDTALHLAGRANKVGEKDQISCVRTLLFHPGIDVNLKNNQGRTAMRDAGYRYLSVYKQVLKTCNDFPADSYGKVVLCGNSGAGKSTLTQAIINISKSTATRFANRVFGREGVVEPLTAGIIPHQVDSPYSNMIIYDLAGHHQFFSSHSACLEAISLNSPAIFLLLQDVTKDSETMAKEVRYWSTMIDNVCHKCPQKSSVIVVGTHADLLKSKQLVKKKESDLEAVFKMASSHQTLVAVITVNLKNIYSAAMDQFRALLYSSNKEVLSMSPPISLMCHMMLAFLKERLPHDMHAILLSDLLIRLDTDQDKFINPDITAVVPLLNTLSEKGLIVFIPSEDTHSSWVVCDKESILKNVNGALFADPVLKKSTGLTSTTGIISTAVLKKAFPEYNCDMITQFMVHFEIGQAVDLSQIKTNMAPEGSTISDFGPLLFIPALVSIDRPSSAPVPNNSFCWSEIVMSDQFFTPRFHHVLLHRLPLEFALPDSQTTSQPLNRLCDVWSRGIVWLSETGVTTIVEMSESFQAISLTMSSPNKASPKYVELSHSVREVIKKARQEFCPYLEVLEVVSCPPECSSDHSIDTRVELSCLRKAILEKETHIVDVSGTKSVAIDEWKKMEPHLSSLVEACTFTGQVLPPVEESTSHVLPSLETSACQPMLSEMIDQVVKHFQDEAPTLPKLLCFSDKKVNIVQQIGVNYSKFGILLLNDNNGTIVKALEKQYCQNAEDIVIAIFGKWLEGMGEKPVAWSTLVATLQKINM